jgi:3-oxoadipate enol-lactonase
LERWFTREYREACPKVIDHTAQMLLQTDRRGYTLSCEAIRDMDFRNLVGTIHAPTMVVYGTKDPVTTPEDARYLFEQIPNASTLSLNAAHLSNIEAADAFSRGVLHFLLEYQGE